MKSPISFKNEPHRDTHENNGQKDKQRIHEKGGRDITHPEKEGEQNETDRKKEKETPFQPRVYHDPPGIVSSKILNLMKSRKAG
jgi:hypothetical protein